MSSAAATTSGTEPGTRDRLLQAAAEVFAERGYEGAAVSDIARRAGFTTGAIYSRFRDKAELLLEVVRGALEAEQSAAVSAASAGIYEELGDRFSTFAAPLLDESGQQDRNLVFEAHAAARRNPDVGAMLSDFQRQQFAALTQLVQDAQDHGEVANGVDPAVVAALFMSIPLGLVMLELTGVELPGPDAWAALAGHMAVALRPDQQPRS
jgi:TetR/AcrR family transcriptional repressor of uid operon